MMGLFASRDARIKELEDRIFELEKRYERALCKKQRLAFQIEEFKKFSPKLWFEYFSQDAGKYSGAMRAQVRFHKWQDERGLKSWDYKGIVRLLEPAPPKER